MNFKWIAAALGLFVLAAGTGAQTTQNAIGSVSAPWLNLVNSARVEGLGEAFVAVADSVDSVGINPAGLAAFPDPKCP